MVPSLKTVSRNFAAALRSFNCQIVNFRGKPLQAANRFKHFKKASSKAKIIDKV